MPNQWYYTKQGQRIGPVSEEQVKLFAQSGEIQPTDMVWAKGMTSWIPAAKVQGLTFAILQEWYYSKNNQQQGPISTEQLKQLAASGQVQPNDLVWKEGMSQWTEARKLKGLFPIQTAANPSSPPPLPAAPVITPIPTATTNSNTTASGEVPALWNPQAAGCWSLLFGWAFGSFLLARNWIALGDQARAKRCMFWFYAFFVWIPVSALVNYLMLHTPQSDPSALRFVCYLAAVLIPYFVWAFVEVNPQTSFIKEQFNDKYTHKPWLKSLSIGFVCMLLLILLSIATRQTGYMNNKEIVQTILMDQQDKDINKANVASGRDLETKEDNNPIASKGKKLIAFKKVMMKYKNIPDILSGGENMRKYVDELQTLQNEFHAISFDPTEQRSEAKQIIELFEQEIEGRYSGEQYRLLENDIGEMCSKMIR